MKKWNVIFKTSTFTAAILVSSGILIGCGSSEKETPQPATDTATQSDAAENSVRITGNDQMRFDLTAFSVQAGQEVTLTFANIGNLPKVAMGHNVVILQAGTNVDEFAQKAMVAVDTDYIPQDAGDQIIAHTKLLGPGESDTITFTAPTQPGNYVYLCTFPGHYAIMQGVMTVK